MLWKLNRSYLHKSCLNYRSIRRIIFYSLIKPIVNEKGEKEMDTLSVSSALQIAGRAGRYGTQWEQGRDKDKTICNNLL